MQINYQEIDGHQFLKLQAKDSQDVLDLSRTQFYNDRSEGNWDKETTEQGTVYYLVPKAYVEDRLERKSIREARKETGQQTNLPLNPSSGEPLSEAIRLLLEQKDATIRLLQEQNASLKEQINRETKLHDAVIEAKGNELISYKTMALLANKKDTPVDTDSSSQLLEYSPTPPTPKKHPLAWLGIGRG